MRLTTGNFPTCIRRIDYPIHKGQPNPSHGKYHFVGSVPVIYAHIRFATEQDAIHAAVLAGAERIQRTDNTFVDIATEQARQQDVCLPTLETVRTTELSLPQLDCPEQPFTLTAPRETEETQTSLF